MLGSTSAEYNLQEVKVSTMVQPAWCAAKLAGNGGDGMEVHQLLSKANEGGKIKCLSEHIGEIFHHDLGFYGKKGFERESTRIRDFIPAGPVPLFPQGCPFSPAGLSFYSRRAVLLFPQGWRSSPGRHLTPARPAPTAMAGIRAARHEGPRR